MDGSQIENLLVLASAKAAHAHQRLTGQLDFCSAGMKTTAETRGRLDFAALRVMFRSFYQTKLTRWAA